MTTVHPLYRASQRSVTLEPDLRGQPLIDAAGEKIGHVHDVLVEERPIEEAGIMVPGITPRYLEVGSGGRFHFGERHALLPIDDVTIEADGVRIKASRFDLFGPDDTLPALPKRFSTGA
ncbi:MAG TPA: PRC-barrel domain-containing protein [Dehalococcoidia bacterium]|nr:PRC-barrel domain-containing protein [Dehalococcoidia bacterium]